jgi:hypothetical protein
MRFFAAVRRAVASDSLVVYTEAFKAAVPNGEERAIAVMIRDSVVVR